MFVPLYDANPLRTIRAPFVTYGLLAISTIIFVVFQSGLMLQAENISIAGFGVIPSEVLLPVALRDPGVPLFGRGIPAPDIRTLR